MRVLILLLLSLTACGRDVCADIDGTCVALTVRGEGRVDGLDITLSGAATGRKIAPEYAQVTDLPTSVALAIDHASTGTLHIGLAAVRGGAIVGEGDADVVIAQGRHVSASLELDATRTDGGTSLFDLSCPDMGLRCGDVCCAAGQACFGGACQYSTAKVSVYICPDFNNGCSSADFVIGTMCSPNQNLKAGACYTTTLEVDPAKSYSIASCMGCNSSCSAGASFMTPAGGFPTPTFYSGISFYCSTPCTAPTSCP
jgi:hypothetical protein